MPATVPPRSGRAISNRPPIARTAPLTRMTTRAMPMPIVYSSVVGCGAVGILDHDDGRAVGHDLAHRARQRGAVVAHRDDRVGADQRRVRDESIEGLSAGVLEEAGVLVDLAAAERAELGHEVAADASAADDQAEHHPLRIGDAMAGDER